jgi:hypothetical protein
MVTLPEPEIFNSLIALSFGTMAKFLHVFYCVLMDRKNHWHDMIVVKVSTIRSLHDQDTEQTVYIDRNLLCCIHAADGTR